MRLQRKAVSSVHYCFPTGMQGKAHVSGHASHCTVKQCSWSGGRSLAGCRADSHHLLQGTVRTDLSSVLSPLRLYFASLCLQLIL